MSKLIRNKHSYYGRNVVQKVTDITVHEGGLEK